jgi:hypothetical protein
MPTTVIPVVMVMDTVVVPVVIPVIATAQSPARTRKTWINVPVRPIRKPVTDVVVSVIADINIVPDIDIRIVPNIRTITTDAWPVYDIVPRVVANVWQIDIRAVPSYDWTIDVAWQSRWTPTPDDRAVDIARQRGWSICTETWSIPCAW